MSCWGKIGQPPTYRESGTRQAEYLDLCSFSLRRSKVSPLPGLAENRAGDALGRARERKESVGQGRYLYIHIVCYLLVSTRTALAYCSYMYSRFV